MKFPQQVGEFQCINLYAYFDNLVRRYATPCYFAISERQDIHSVTKI